MPKHTHVIEFDGGEIVEEIGAHRDVSIFANPLRRLNGCDRWALTLYALPPDMIYEQMQDSEWDPMEFLQAGGTANEMTVEICKPGGELWAALWGAKWVRFAVVHQHEGDAALDVPIQLSGSTEMVSEPEVFIADEAAELFESYCTTGDIPSKFWLRPIDGYDEDGNYIPPPVETGSGSDEPSRQVYRGDIPGDFYEGRWPNRLTIYAAIGPEGLILNGHDSVEWPDKDQYWTIRLAPEQLPLLREVLGAASDIDATDVLDLVATRFEDRTVPVRGVAWWLKEAGIEYHASQEFLEN